MNLEPFWVGDGESSRTCRKYALKLIYGYMLLKAPEAMALYREQTNEMALRHIRRMNGRASVGKQTNSAFEYLQKCRHARNDTYPVIPLQTPFSSVREGVSCGLAAIIIASFARGGRRTDATLNKAMYIIENLDLGRIYGRGLVIRSRSKLMQAWSRMSWSSHLWAAFLASGLLKTKQNSLVPSHNRLTLFFRLAYEFRSFLEDYTPLRSRGALVTEGLVGIPRSFYRDKPSPALKVPPKLDAALSPYWVGRYKRA